ncbi:alpha-mannosidase [Isoptericola croceus]|uniref:alpha-mannosidase n=1 Tax=Isoptericola croceus TaxID=3031406 RepID=UPI0023F6C8B1|nr:alpha-mannosidase [Isoptericola croceus]
MHAAPHLTLERVDRFLHEFLPAGVVADRRPLEVGAWEVPGRDGRPGEPVAFEQMRAQARFAPAAVGQAWGSPWGTTWLHVRGVVPAGWRGAGRIELSIDLGFNGAKPGFQCEGLVRTPDGVAVKGLEPRNHHVPVAARPGESIELFVEAASNPDVSGGDDFKHPLAFTATSLGDPGTAGAGPLYRLGAMDLRRIDIEAETLLREVTVLRGLAGELGASDPRRATLLAGLEKSLYAIDPDDPGRDAASARAILAPLLASPAVPSAHRIVATGHAHIDSAWLWPTRETVRKVGRTYANVLALMDSDPELVFVSSSAQHFAWVRDSDPELYARVKERVAEGRFVPVGNMWVESDVTMPSGESLARQLLYGTRFFDEEFGVRSDVGWLPDSFGYPGSLPQLLRRAGIRWFFTQKMCWNDHDTMPHHSFWWEGIDGTQVFTHFPPNNTYSGDMRPTELARSVRNFADHGGATTSLMPYGYGDGGGGPTREMTADARLQSDLEGSPRVETGTPRDFFLAAEEEYRDAPVWSGEMYLQFHRGTLTSQQRTKRGNRRNEALLVEAEVWCAAATLRTGAAYPYDELDELWREVLLLQFHDILPGSAIAWVHREAEESHARTTERLAAIVSRAVAALVGTGERRLTLNPAPVAYAGVPALGGALDDRTGTDGAMTAAQTDADASGFRLTSSALDVRVAPDGTITSIVDRSAGRDLVAPGHPVNQVQVHVDAPAKWDAWELDRSYRLSTVDFTDGAARLEAPGVVRVDRTFGDSRLTQRISLDTTGGAVLIRTTVDWYERRRLLKLAFPLDLHAHDAAFETQFGHVRRPLHQNTSWDAARYEVCAHRWVHVGEPGFGVAIANDGMYGHDTTRTSVDGHVLTTVRQSLLRAPTFPDPVADQGSHEFVSVIAPAPTTDDAARWGAVIGSPLRTVVGAVAPDPVVAIEGDGSAVVSCVKLAADRSGDVVVRVHEQRGARTAARLRWGFAAAGARECDLVETPLDEPTGALRGADGAAADLVLRPFEVLTLRVTPQRGQAA